MKRPLLITAALALPFLFSSTLFADADAAKGYLKDAQDLIEKNDLEGAGNKLDLAETELDGVDDAAKKPIANSIAAAKQKIINASAAADKPKYKRQLDRAMDDAESGIGNLATWPGAEARFNELMADPKAKAALGADLDAAAKKFATFKKLNTKKAAVAHAAEAEDSIKQTEEIWAESKKEFADPDASPNSKEAAIDKTSRYLEDSRKAVKKLPDGDEHIKGFNERLDKVAAEYTRIGLADKVKEELETLKRQFETYKNDWEGYEKETTGPTWEEYQQKSSEKMDAFLAPHTRDFISRIGDFLEHLEEEEDYKAVKADDSIKAFVADVKSKYDAAYAKMVKLVTPVVEAAVKAPVKDADKLDVLKGNVRLALGEKSPEGLALQDKLTKKVEAHAAATTGAEEARVKLIETLSAKAKAEWPKLHEGIQTTNDLDFSHADKLVGKTIIFHSGNMMGYHFKPGDFYFATTFNGIAVAGKFDPQLMKQITATEKAIGRSIGDDDNDGKWEIIAVVTDRKARLMARRDTEATGTVDGSTVKVASESYEPVDAVVIEIIAAKCGPFAGAKGKGVLKEDGTIGK